MLKETNVIDTQSLLHLLHPKNKTQINQKHKFHYNKNTPILFLSITQFDTYKKKINYSSLYQITSQTTTNLSK